jgi:CheY-like chemotaxis protein
MPSATRKRPPAVQTVLVIDDDEVMRELLCAILATDGYVVHAVESGTAALDWLEQQQADVLLADLRLPGLHGAELAQRLNAVRGPGTVLLGMSGSEPQPGERASFDAFLLKPFGLESFAQVVEAARSRVGAEPAAEVTDAADGVRVLDESIFRRLSGMLPAARLRELYQISTQDVLRRVERMREAVDRGDFEECRSQAHAIKGGCGMVGAVELSAMAARIEAGSSADTPPLADFAVACARLQRMLDARL